MHVSDPGETAPMRIGEVARATGLTVRTLHHYDEIGLLVPSHRSDAGYRLYSDGDVRRLYRILALRGMGSRSARSPPCSSARARIRGRPSAGIWSAWTSSCGWRDARLDPLVERWTELIRQFTGGDAGIKASLQAMYDTEGPERASRGAVTAETMEYARRAIDARVGH